MTQITTIMTKQHFGPFMPHLPCKPEEIRSLANVLSSVSVPSLIWGSVSNTSLSRCRNPGFFSNCVSTCPCFVSFWIFKNRFIPHKSEQFLTGKSRQCLFSQFYFPCTCFCFCSFDDANYNYAGILNMCSFPYKVYIPPTKSAQFRATQPGLD